MSLIIATGANIGNKLENLSLAKQALCERFRFVAQSNIYSSPPVGYEDQPSFYNQVLEFELPAENPENAMAALLEIEKSLGRKRETKWGPRSIDLDIIFWGLKRIDAPGLEVPHPRWDQRAFVVLPLRELPFFQVLKKSYKIPKTFDHQATIISKVQK